MYNQYEGEWICNGGKDIDKSCFYFEDFIWQILHSKRSVAAPGLALFPVSLAPWHETSSARQPLAFSTSLLLISPGSDQVSLVHFCFDHEYFK